MLRKNAWNKPDVVQGFTQLRRQLENEVFKGAPVELKLCDEYLDVQATIK